MNWKTKWRRRIVAMRRRLRVASGLVSRREQRFQSVYEDRDWGTLEGAEYYSGPGALRENAAPYAEFLSEYIREHGIGRVVDLGCGDYRASQLVDFGSAHYVGVDIVRGLIEHNQRDHGSERVEFRHSDLLRGELPAGDLCLIKHVLQHWSNADILTFLPRLEAYRHVLILDGSFAEDSDSSENEDILTGPAFRQGGLRLESPPFDCEVETVFTYSRLDEGETMRLVRYRGRHRRS